MTQNTGKCWNISIQANLMNLRDCKICYQLNDAWLYMTTRQMSLNNVYKWKNASTVKAQNITAMLQHELSRKKDRYVERLWRSASAAECLNFYTVLAQICVAVLKELNQKHKNQRFNYTFNGPTQYRTTKQCQVAMVTKQRNQYITKII